MSKRTKAWFIATISISLMAFGLIIFAAALAVGGWDLGKLSASRLEPIDQEITDSFSSISIVGDSDNISFVISDDQKCRVEYYNRKNLTYSVSVSDGILSIGLDDTRKWYEHISFFTPSTQLTVYLSKTEYDALSVKSDTGDIDIPCGLGFGDVDISVSTGDISYLSQKSGNVSITVSTGDIYIEGGSFESLTLTASTGDMSIKSTSCSGDIVATTSTGEKEISDTTCKNLTLTADTGKTNLTNTVVSCTVTINADTGDVTLNECDANEIYIETSTGDVTGTLLSEKIFIPITSTGNISVPETLSGGKCKITTSTGDIEISIK